MFKLSDFLAHTLRHSLYLHDRFMNNAFWCAKRKKYEVSDCDVMFCFPPPPFFFRFHLIRVWHVRTVNCHVILGRCHREIERGSPRQRRCRRPQRKTKMASPISVCAVRSIFSELLAIINRSRTGLCILSSSLT